VKNGVKGKKKRKGSFATKGRGPKFERKKIEKAEHQVYGLIDKLKSLPESKTREIMIPKKVLLKSISGFYEDRFTSQDSN
jgi:DNA-binding transcriptional regulator YhcF (GntR family)